jgi:hypothetical protein
VQIFGVEISLRSNVLVSDSATMLALFNNVSGTIGKVAARSSGGSD